MRLRSHGRNCEKQANGEGNAMLVCTCVFMCQFVPNLMSGNARNEHSFSCLFVQANRIVLIGTVDELCK
jgi:hypothetical protein